MRTAFLCACLCLYVTQVSCGYTPNQAVQNGHAIPHLVVSDGALIRGPDSFSLDGEVLSGQGYLAALLPFPIIVTSLGLLCIVLYHVVLCFRCCACCRCLKHKPTEEEAATDGPAVATRRRRVLAAYALAVGFTLLALHTLWLANKDMDDGIALLGSGISSLNDIFISMQASGGEIEAAFEATARAAADSPDCFSSAERAQSVSEAGSIAGGGIASLSRPVVPLLSAAAANVVQNGQQYKLYVLSSLYAAGTLLLLLLSLAVWRASKLATWAVVFITQIVLVASTLLSGVEMVVVMLLGDFCMDPISLVQSLTTSESVKNILAFYGRCDGGATNPFGADTSTSSATAGYFSDSAVFANTVDARCAAVQQAVLSFVGRATAALDSVTSKVTECASLHRVLDQSLHRGVCGSGYSGLFKLFVAQYCSALGLFLLLVMTSLAWQYFDPYLWTLPLHDSRSVGLRGEHGGDGEDGEDGDGDGQGGQDGQDGQGGYGAKGGVEMFRYDNPAYGKNLSRGRGRGGAGQEEDTEDDWGGGQFYSTNPDPLDEDGPETNDPSKQHTGPYRSANRTPSIAHVPSAPPTRPQPPLPPGALSLNRYPLGPPGFATKPFSGMSGAPPVAVAVGGGVGASPAAASSGPHSRYPRAFM